jgi:hypothetical protein
VFFKMAASHFVQVNDEEMFIFIFYPNNHLWNYTKIIIHLTDNHLAFGE